MKVLVSGFPECFHVYVKADSEGMLTKPLTQKRIKKAIRKVATMNNHDFDVGCPKIEVLGLHEACVFLRSKAGRTPERIIVKIWVLDDCHLDQ